EGVAPAEFKEDGLSGRKLLEAISGAPVRGFRAPAFSVPERTPWFFDKLAEAGYQYDSSVFPAPHQTGGLANSRFEPYQVQTAAGPPTEISLPAVRVTGKAKCFLVRS